MTIDLATVRDMERAARSGAVVEVTADWLAQVMKELGEGRDAQARLGQCFGLPSGEKI